MLAISSEQKLADEGGDDEEEHKARVSLGGCCFCFRLSAFVSFTLSVSMLHRLAAVQLNVCLAHAYMLKQILPEPSTMLPFTVSG